VNKALTLNDCGAGNIEIYRNIRSAINNGGFSHIVGQLVGNEIRNE
jgi:hypothetical protein